ncbi:hypothetical protein M5K25_014208 [Dendrobium thyrsiflorum]|uniref:Uncharacterized protein n=1 Tax=Dendrobium thyrsiflorum TaxID=117978 RepID=A0ABD0UVG5_DENTH
MPYGEIMLVDDSARMGDSANVPDNVNLPLAASSPVPNSIVKLDLSPNVIAEEPFVDVPISILSNGALRAYLGLALKDPYVDHTYWIDESFSSPGVGGGEDLDGPDDDFNEMFNLKLGVSVIGWFDVVCLDGFFFGVGLGSVVCWFP